MSDTSYADVASDTDNKLNDYTAEVVKHVEIRVKGNQVISNKIKVRKPRGSINFTNLFTFNLLLLYIFFVLG